MQLLATAFVPMPELSCVDCFAGKRAISRAFVGAGERAVALDILLTPKDDSWTRLWKKQQYPQTCPWYTMCWLYLILST